MARNVGADDTPEIRANAVGAALIEGVTGGTATRSAFTGTDVSFGSSSAPLSELQTLYRGAFEETFA